VSPRVALVSTRAARDLDEDMPPLLAAFAAAGAHAEIADWNDDGADWGRFDLALLRSAWDYTERLPEFLRWAEHVAARTALFNTLEVVRWNCDKHYLQRLAAQDVAVVPSSFVEPGTPASQVLDEFLARYGQADLVVKPAVGAGSRDARRHARSERAAILAHMQALLDQRRSVLLQPYLGSVDHHGESALIYIDGRFSHAIRKGPLLPRGADASDALFAAEQITVRGAAAEERALAERIFAALPFGRLLYARVDLIRDDHGNPVLLELELTEPSLFLAHAPGSAERLAATALARLKR
jgi:glutathione synthase/RimK-type ligase-like ATP-grasp enzyme